MQRKVSELVPEYADRILRIGADQNGTAAGQRNPGTPRRRPAAGQGTHSRWILGDDEPDGAGIEAPEPGPFGRGVGALSECYREVDVRRPGDRGHLPDLHRARLGTRLRGGGDDEER